MKRIYSVILLVSFLIGVAQPILPMIEYQLDEGDIVEFFSKGASNADNSCDLNVCKLEHCEKQQSDVDQKLLNIDYYPLALQITSVPKPIAFPYKTTLYLFAIISIDSPPMLPIPPPPRLS